MDDGQSQHKHLTPDEIARIEKDERERLEKLVEHRSLEEAVAWLDAHEDDLETGMEALMQEKADLVAIQQAVASIIQEHPNMRREEALEFIRQKHKRTLPEAEALDAFDRLKGKRLLRTIRIAGKTYAPEDFET
jgi:hypothetical protein